MKMKWIGLAAFGAALALAPAAWAKDAGSKGSHGGMESMEGMHHEGMQSMSATAQAHKHAKKAKQAKHAKKAGTKAEAKRYHYVCPMHDGGESDKPGRCPKCGMDLVKEEIQPEAKQAGKKADAKPAADHESMQHHVDGEGHGE